AVQPTIRQRIASHGIDLLLETKQGPYLQSDRRSTVSSVFHRVHVSMILHGASCGECTIGDHGRASRDRRHIRVRPRSLKTYTAPALPSELSLASPPTPVALLSSEVVPTA